MSGPEGRRLDWDTSPYDEHLNGRIVVGLAHAAWLGAAEDAVTRHGVVPDATDYGPEVTEFDLYHRAALGRGAVNGNY